MVASVEVVHLDAYFGRRWLPWSSASEGHPPQAPITNDAVALRVL